MDSPKAAAKQNKIMSHFDILHAELVQLRTRQFIAVMVPTVAVAGVVIYATS